MVSTNRGLHIILQLSIAFDQYLSFEIWKKCDSKL